MVIAFSVTLVILLALGIGLGVKLHYDKKHQISPAVKNLLEGNYKELNRQLSIDEQTEYLPYDKRWEFPRYRLKLGMQLGVRCFGRVVKADAVGVKDSEGTVKTVAVKMVKSKINPAAMEAMVSELKILIYLGSHLNVVNLLGACTKNIHKGELLVIVEYCRYGSLQTYLTNHRNGFIDMVDEFGNMISDKDEEYDYNASALDFRENKVANEDGNLVSNNEESPVLELNQQDWDSTSNHRSVSTRDLISWSFQIARGMGYLVSKNIRPSWRFGCSECFASR